MKFILLFVLLTSQVFASVTPAERKEATSQAKDVMLIVSGETELNAKVMSAGVTDELGTRLIVEFSYMESMYSTHNCSYVYDRVLKKVVKNSWLCEI